jgi:CRP-like cAMP-binding protein
MGLHDDAPRNAHVVATTPMTLMILSGAALKELQREKPELARQISSTIEQRRRWLEPVL